MGTWQRGVITRHVFAGVKPSGCIASDFRAGVGVFGAQGRLPDAVWA
jgi:hypothetical protein